jgi:hypothetical protein
VRCDADGLQAFCRLSGVETPERRPRPARAHHDATRSDHGQSRVDLEGRRPRAGKLGEVVAKVAGSVPLAKVKDDLRRFRQHVETGEIVRSDGTPEGELAERKLKQRPAQPLEEVGAP